MAPKPEQKELYCPQCKSKHVRLVRGIVICLDCDHGHRELIELVVRDPP